MNVGEVLDGRYELVSLIGHGGMGEVWEARDRSARGEGQRVALKSLHPHLMTEKELVARFLREAKAALEARYSAHIIEVLDVVHMPERPPYLVMEYLEGENLFQTVDREGPLEIARAVDLIIQTCDALDEVHRLELVHRDIKPDNLFVTRLPGGAEWIKLLDFGVVKFAAIATSAPRLTNVGSTIGTPQYMAPEQAMRPDKIDFRVDIYSVGVVLYQLLTGHVPYETDNFQEILLRIARKELVPPTQLRPEIGEGLEDIVLRAMAMDPEDRFQSVMDLNYALQRYAKAPSRSSSSMLKTIIEEIPTSVVASFFPRQGDTQPGLSSDSRGLTPADTVLATPVSLLDHASQDTDPGTSLSELESDHAETEIIDIGRVEESLSRDTDPDAVEQAIKTTISHGESERAVAPAQVEAPQVSPADARVSDASDDDDTFQEPSAASTVNAAEEGTSEVESLRVLIKTVRDLLFEAFPWLTPRLVILLASAAALISITIITTVSLGLNCLCASNGDEQDWASLITADETDGGITMFFDGGVEDDDAWHEQDSSMGGGDGAGEVEEIDHYGGLERYEVISALRSLTPAVNKCLRRSGRRPGSRVNVHFWVHKSGVLAYRRTRPPIKRAAALCLRRSVKGRRLPRQPDEPFVAIYPYRVPRR